MNVKIKETDIEISRKYYSIIEYHAYNLVGEYLNLNFNKEIFVSLSSAYDDDGDVFIFIVLECDDAEILNEELNEMSWFDEGILVNRKLINE